MENKNTQSISEEVLIPVILSGGLGSRLWPLSRSTYPKQYLNLNEINKFSLLQNTYLRLKGLKNLSNPLIVSNEEQRFIVAEQMREIGVTPSSILLEPIGKNTAPAIALASLKALNISNNPTLIILSSDHKIEDEENFKKVLKQGIQYASKGELVTFGIIPNSPETGYGYIESFDELSINNTSSKIKNFIEKPNAELAKNLIKDRHYLWNSGIFVFKASVVLKELEKFEPELIKSCKESFKKGKFDLDFFRINSDTFKVCPNIPFDIAVMEKTNLGRVVKFDAGWDDIGSWHSIWNNSKKDKNGNMLKGEIINCNSKNCYLRSEGRLIAAIDLDNLIVVETEDALLISDKNSTQKVKNVVEELMKRNLPEGKENKKSFRPWGSFTNIEKGSTWQVKKLEIKPFSSISLQKHEYRSEHWVVVSGLAKVQLNKETKYLKPNQSVYIPTGAKHRLSNAGEAPLILIEIQSGAYIGEDDIIRFEDNYGRLNYP